MEIYYSRQREKYLLDLRNSREAPQFSGSVQVDAAAEVEEDNELRSGAGVQTCRCVAKGGRR